MKAVYKLFSFLGIVLYLLGPLFVPAVAFAAGPSLAASPASGRAPLAVTLSGDTGAGCNGGNFTMVFGDGQTNQFGQAADRCVGTFNISHTYTAAGTYTAKLTDGTGKTLVSTQVSVTAATSPTTSGAAPTCQLTLNTTSIQVGGSVTLRWTSTNATAGAITNVGNVSPSGSINLLPSSATYTTYIGSFTGPGGTANCSATVQVTTGAGGVGDSTSGDTNYGTKDAQLGTGTFTPPAATNGPATTVNSSPAGALVTCGTGIFQETDTSQNNSTGCQACNLADLVQNIINFLIGLSIPIAAALFAYAGVLYFTSAGDHHKLDQAKQIFKDALIGFVIVITAWLVINTVLHVIFSQGEFANGSWFSIQCATTPRPVTGNIGTILGTILGTGNITTNGTPSGGSAYVCPNGSTQRSDGLCYDPDGNSLGVPSKLSQTSANNGLSCAQYGSGYAEAGGQCYSADSSISAGAAVPDAPVQSGTGDCSPAALAQDFDDPGDVAAMSCVLPRESGSSCNPNLGSGVDVGTDGKSVSWGQAQINISANVMQCDGFNNGQPVNCPSAFSGAYTGKNHNVQVTNQDLYNQCVTMAKNVSCNREMAQGILNKQGICAWGAAKQCNVGC